MIGAIGSGINEIGMIPRLLDLVDLDFFLVALRYTLGEQSALEVGDAALRRARHRLRHRRGVQLRALRDRADSPARSSTTRTPRPSSSTGPARSRRSASAMAYRSPPRRSSSRCTTRWSASVIPGAFKPEHVTANVKAMEHRHPRRAVGRAQAREADPAGRADAVGEGRDPPARAPLEPRKSLFIGRTPCTA